MERPKPSPDITYLAESSDSYFYGLQFNAEEIPACHYCDFEGGPCHPGFNGVVCTGVGTENDPRNQAVIAIPTEIIGHKLEALQNNDHCNCDLSGISNPKK